MRRYKNCLVSKEGDIFSVFTGKKRKPQLVSGYLYINTGTDKSLGKEVRERVHRIVAFLYLDNPENKPQVNHKDGNKLNNHVDNLEWCSMAENHRHAFENGIRKAKKGSECSYAKLKEQDIPEIKRMYREGILQRVIAKKFGVSLSTINGVIKNRRWKSVAQTSSLNTLKELDENSLTQRIDVQKAGIVTASEDSDDCGVYHSASIYPGNPGSFGFN